MNQRLKLGGRTIFVYQFPCRDPRKVELLENFLKEFALVCESQPIDSFENHPELRKLESVILFLVFNISDFDFLLHLDLPESAVKVVSYFFLEEEFHQVNLKSFRSAFKSRVFRLIYPDKINSFGLRYSSADKVFDTIYARTVRNKFNAVQLETNVQAFTHLDTRSAFADIIQMGWYLRDMGLNHSDSAAGGIALRFGQGILVTASKTDKYHIENDRICYLVNYIPENNTVEYVGNYPPSSESALAYYAFREFNSANLILHFHYKPMTCAHSLQRYQTEEYISYGTFAEAKAVAEKLRETQNFVIAKGHGEFVFASDFSDAKATVDQILSVLH
jgi:ribulose-5-phosphate 4-epimerase/fuculose-1-phosphate aldolase